MLNGAIPETQMLVILPINVSGIPWPISATITPTELQNNRLRTDACRIQRQRTQPRSRRETACACTHEEKFSPQQLSNQKRKKGRHALFI